MKKVLLGVVGLVVVAVAVVLGLAATKPSTFKYERKATIGAPPATVYANLDDFHRWSAWSPWEKLDPRLKREFSGPSQGVGATYNWHGNQDAGRGRMTITESKTPERLVIHLEFFEPFEGDNQTEFVLTPSAAGTDVSWVMTGPNTFVGKIFLVVADVDEMVGNDFDRGLANLKQVSEADAKSGS